MIIIGEKINGAIPSIKKAIAEIDAELIKKRAIAQSAALIALLQQTLTKNMTQWYGLSTSFRK